jgi:hypothetical protein
MLVAGLVVITLQKPKRRLERFSRRERSVWLYSSRHTRTRRAASLERFIENESAPKTSSFFVT